MACLRPITDRCPHVQRVATGLSNPEPALLRTCLDLEEDWVGAGYSKPMPNQASDCGCSVLYLN